MRQRNRMVIPALFGMVLMVVTASFAGGDHVKCTKSTQECLDSMVASVKAHGWVGLEMDKDDSGTLSVKRVVEGSPAEAAGFKKGDVLVALNGIKFSDDNEDALMAAKKSMAPGKQVKYTISRNGVEKVLTPTLAEVPTEVLAQWIGNHMLEHATTMVASK